MRRLLQRTSDSQTRVSANSRFWPREPNSKRAIFVTPHIVRDAAKVRQIVLNELRNRQDRIDAELEAIGFDDGSAAAPVIETPSDDGGLLGPK